MTAFLRPLAVLHLFVFQSVHFTLFPRAHVKAVLLLLLQKVLSELQAENLRKLKDREQELKELKKAMEVMKVRRRS